MRIFVMLSMMFLVAACGHHHKYALQDDVKPDVKMSFKGTVLSVEKDGDFLLDSCKGLLFVDVGAIKNKDEAEVELGDRVMVSGHTDNDAHEGEAPELDAEKIRSWVKGKKGDCKKSCKDGFCDMKHEHCDCCKSCEDGFCEHDASTCDCACHHHHHESKMHDTHTHHKNHTHHKGHKAKGCGCGH